jgi:hypothetical protein
MKTSLLACLLSLPALSALAASEPVLIAASPTAQVGTWQQYRKELKRQIKSLQTENAALREKIAGLTKDAQAEADRRYADLKKLDDDVNRRYKEMKKSGHRKWMQYRAGMDKAVDDLKKAYFDFEESLSDKKKDQKKGG